MLENGGAEKKPDSFTVMARAIQRHYHDNGEKIPPETARFMEKIIDDGFLNAVIAEEALHVQKRLLKKMSKKE